MFYFSDLLSRVSRSDLSNAAFPFGTARTIDVAYATVRAARITYVGMTLCLAQSQEAAV